MAKGEKNVKPLHSLKSVVTENNTRLWWIVSTVISVLWILYTPINAGDLVKGLTVEVLIGIATLAVFFYTPFIVLSLHYEGIESLPWDNKVIINKVADMFGGIAYMLLYLIAPIVVWNLIPVNHDWQGRSKIFILGIFAVGIGAFITYTMRLARWFDNATDKVSADYRTRLRVKYLENLPESEQLLVWGPATWDKLEKQPSPNAREIVNVFFDQLGRQSDDTHIRSIALLDFIQNIDKIHLYEPCIYNKALKFSITHAFDTSTNRQVKIKPAYYTLQMKNMSQGLFEAITKRSIYNPAVSSFFSTIQYRLRGDKAKLDKQHLINTVMKEIICVLEDAGTGHKDSVWDSFCDEWKISVENIENNTPSVNCLEAYIEWFTHDYINKLHLGSSENPDKMYAVHATHTSILRNMFVDIDINIWLKLMILQYLPYPMSDGGDNKSEMRLRMRNYIDSSIVESVAMSTRTVIDVAWGEDIDAAQKPVIKKSKELDHETTNREKNVLALVKHTDIFSEFRSIERLKRFIDASEELLNEEKRKSSQNKATITKLQDIIEILNKLIVDLAVKV